MVSLHFRINYIVIITKPRRDVLLLDNGYELAQTSDIRENEVGGC